MPPAWTTGVVVGKFNPPHLGHVYLIQQASHRVERLYVILCDRQDQTLSAAQRREWLLDATPSNVRVLVTPDDLPPSNEPWARRALEILPEPPDVAFTSEDWGQGWAELMGAEHVLVDRHRNAFPISGTALRSDLGREFAWLVPAARQALARRVLELLARASNAHRCYVWFAATRANEHALANYCLALPELAPLRRHPPGDDEARACPPEGARGPQPRRLREGDEVAGGMTRRCRSFTAVIPAQRRSRAEPGSTPERCWWRRR